MKYIILILSLLYLSGCDKFDCKFKYINKSCNTIYVLVTLDSTFHSASHDFSILYNRMNGSMNVYADRFYRKNDTGCQCVLGGWDKTDYDAFFGKNVYVYVIDSVNIGLDSIEYENKKNIIIRQYSVSREYMNSHNWYLEVR